MNETLYIRKIHSQYNHIVLIAGIEKLSHEIRRKKFNELGTAQNVHFLV